MTSLDIGAWQLVQDVPPVVATLLDPSMYPATTIQASATVVQAWVVHAATIAYQDTTASRKMVVKVLQ